ncbi:homoserine kinase [Sulfoacidibacillus thermotolerans]|uniref:homoserine kinase n=1 Tax=Sulfoacidibacillus thermotolerans TaxID=1765684 RepID=UPI0015E81CFB|nr:homoserine kinase [Sulfoacidibacillus thermotolerans]
MKISVYVPATSANLGPGFDCMGIALDLWNELHVEPADQTTIDIEGFGAEFLPRDESNLVLQSMRLVYDRYQLTLPPLHLRMVNRIPIAAGLGSSAAALVGGLLIANNLLDSPLSRAQILRFAVLEEGHPDNVAPAFLGGAVLAYLHEDGVTHVNLPLRDNFTFIAVTPDFPLLTEQARNVLSPTVTRQDAIFNIAHAGFLTAALTTGNTQLLRRALADRLHQEARKHLIPGFDRVTAAAKASGAVGTVLSGAGPTLLSIVDDPMRATPVAHAMTTAFAQEGIHATAQILAPAQIGAYTHMKMNVKK